MKNVATHFSFFRRVNNDTNGSILIQATITIVAALGLVGLALDGARYFMVHNDLQALADAAALAGAAKLDGSAGSMTRADASARAVVNSVHWYDVSAPEILSGTAGVQFYQTLNDIDANNPTTVDKNAIYIKVTTGSWQVAPTFVRSVSVITGGLVSNDSTNATATATSGSAMCVPAAMMLCNPNEPLTGSTGDTSSFNPNPGTMYVFSTTGNTGGYSPGVFNLLDDANGNGSDPAIRNLLSQQFVNGCNTGTVGPAQGQKTNATIDGMNVRFDQQTNNSNSPNNSGFDQTPAPIKIGGLKLSNGNNVCNFNKLAPDTPTDFPTYVSQCATDHTISCKLPRDENLPAPNAGGIASGSGPTQADLQAYWANHHSTPFATVFPTTDYPSGPTRYDMYLKEVAGMSDWLTDGVEPHAPQCARSSLEVPPEYAAIRRVLHVAIIDCVYWGIRGNAVNNVRLNKYADFFVTEPVPSGGTEGGNIYVEFVGNHAIDTTGSSLHSIVRLVR